MLIYIDIEVVPEFMILAYAPEHVQDYFRKRHAKDADAKLTSLQGYYESNVSFMPEFSKVACVTLAYKVEGQIYAIKSYCGDEELDILTAVADALQRIYASATNKKQIVGLCGHNIADFDKPFICKRFIKHIIQLPTLLNTGSKKPWEIPDVDTMQVAKFGSFKGAVSLDNLCYMLNVKSPKGEIDGSQVAALFYSEDPDRLLKIAAYCEEDVRAVIEVEDQLSQRYELLNGITLNRQ